MDFFGREVGQTDLWIGFMFLLLIWLVVWNIFSIYGNVIIPTDFHIVQRGRYTTNQSCSLTEKLEDEEKNHQPSWVLGVHGAVHQFSRMVFQMLIRIYIQCGALQL